MQRDWPLYTINDNTGKASPEIIGIYKYLNEQGYRAFKEFDEFELYKIEKPFIDRVHESHMHKEIQDYFFNAKIEPYDYQIGPKKEPKYIEVNKNTILENITKYGFGKIIKPENHGYLQEEEIKVPVDGKDYARIYFKNCYIEITKEAIVKKNYNEVQGYVLKSQMRNHDLNLLSPEEYKNYGVIAPNAKKFTEFLNLICLKKADDNTQKSIEVEGTAMQVDSDKLRYLMQLMGYCLHNFKMKGGTEFSPIFCDDEAGGSGKGLIIQAFEKITSVSSLDCKIKLPDFSPRTLTKFTRLNVYQDISKQFDFKRLYNEITEFGTIMYKNENAFTVPFEEQWKTIVTSNHIIRGNTDADIRRQKPFELFPFFSSKKRVMDYFGHSFFSNAWSAQDWNYFYYTIFLCIQEWLKCDYNIEYKDETYLQRKVDDSYPATFRDFIDKLPLYEYFDRGELFNKFIEHDKYVTADYGKNSKYIQKFILSGTRPQNLFSKMTNQYLAQMDKFVMIENHNKTKFMLKPKKES